MSLIGSALFFNMQMLTRCTSTPTGGFGWSPRYMALAKLKAMVAGAQIVRNELST